MATSTLEAYGTGSDSIIAGYFTSGEEAHRAIHALLDAGFLPSQIGAAFHTTGNAEPLYGDESIRQQPGRTFNEEAVDVDTSAGGPSSGSDAVQPVGLASGSGSPILGAGKPGPIPGAELAHSGLLSELPHELGHDQPGSAPFEASPNVASPSVQELPAKKAGWSSKLRHLFQPKTDEPGTSEQGKFGTGEGSLSLRPYSRIAFATSMTGAGVPEEDSRHLSLRLSTGGAVVTVSATGRAVEVEKIFERHNGVVRFESDIFEDTPKPGYAPHVEVFGHLEHRYPVI